MKIIFKFLKVLALIAIGLFELTVLISAVDYVLFK